MNQQRVGASKSDQHCDNLKCNLNKVPIKGTVIVCEYCCNAKKAATYCSDRCMRLDWQARHQFDCEGYHIRQTEVNDNLLQQAEVKNIEKTTPFIKQGVLLSAESVREEQMLASIQLSDLTFEDAKQIGKGSYGTVQLAIHRKSGIRVAVKKIDKRSLTSAKMRETLRREI